MLVLVRVLVCITCSPWYQVQGTWYVQGSKVGAWYLTWWYQMRYKKRLILFICTSHGLLICREKIMRQYEAGTNEKYRLFLYLTVAR